MCAECKRCVGGHEGLGAFHLHKEEVYALIMRAARCVGLKVRTEVPAAWVSARSAMDCGWYTPRGRLVAAFEFDGRDVADEHINGNVAKFAGCSAPIKAQILYSACNDLSAKRAGRVVAVSELVGPNVRVITDEQLMQGALERLLAEALEAAGMAKRDGAASGEVFAPAPPVARPIP